MDNNLVLQETLELDDCTFLYKILDRSNNKVIYITKSITMSSPIALHTQII